MSSNRNTAQTLNKVSIPKNAIIDSIIQNSDNLNRKDLLLLFLLFTKLDGWSVPEGGPMRDPLNYQKIDIYWAADTLGTKPKKIKESLENLIMEGLIEEGSDGRLVEHGYRFTF